MNNPNLPLSVNFHLLQPCNMRCRFCYATFRDVTGQLDRTRAVALIRKLADAGFQKITFAGGEPTLCKWLPDLVRAAKTAGMTTMLVTNGSRLHRADWVFHPDRPLDWVALSIDSASEDTHLSLGRAERGRTISRARYIRLARRLREAGIRLKVNTVVTSLTASEDMSEFIRALSPERWKVLRVLPVGGQNDGKVEPLVVTQAQFEGFGKRHAHLANHGITVVNEDHEDIIAGYAMIDPIGRFFDDTKGHHTYSRPILDVGVHTAFAEVTFSNERFVRRGGVYQWRGTPAKREPLGAHARLVALSGRSGSGKDAVAGHLVARGYVRVAVADTLKHAMRSIFELDDDQLWGEGRNVIVPRLGATPRELYQRFSDACTAIDSEVWLRPWRRELERRLNAGERVVCSDIRTKAELAIISALGGTRIRLCRSGAGAPGAARAHHTETEMEDVDRDEFDGIIDNDSDLQTLFARVDELMRRHGA